MSKGKKTGLTIGSVIGLLIVIIWTCYLATLPNLEHQLKLSPFNVVGTWECNETDFVITSNKETLPSSIEQQNQSNGKYEIIIVTCQINYNNNLYNLELNYVSTRGFNHKYAAHITANSKYNESGKNYKINFSGYKFSENNFSLIIYEDNIFNGEFKTLTFNKTN